MGFATVDEEQATQNELTFDPNFAAFQFVRFFILTAPNFIHFFQIRSFFFLVHPVSRGSF